MSTQYYYFRDWINKLLSRAFKTRFEGGIRQSQFMPSAFGPSGKPKDVQIESRENKEAYEEEYQALVNSIIDAIRDKVYCDVLSPDYTCQEQFGVKERLERYVGWSSGTLATLRTLFWVLDSNKKFRFSKSYFVQFLDLMGESSSDHEREARINEMMKSKEDMDLDEFIEMVYDYSHPSEPGKLGELAYRVFLYSIKQDCMSRADIPENMSQCFL